MKKRVIQSLGQFVAIDAQLTDAVLAAMATKLKADAWANNASQFSDQGGQDETHEEGKSLFEDEAPDQDDDDVGEEKRDRESIHHEEDEVALVRVVLDPDEERSERSYDGRGVNYSKHTQHNVEREEEDDADSGAALGSAVAAAPRLLRELVLFDREKEVAFMMTWVFDVLHYSSNNKILCSPGSEGYWS